MAKGAQGPGSLCSHSQGVPVNITPPSETDSYPHGCGCCLESRVCVITLYTQWGPLPVPVLCPYCKRQIVTKTVYSSGFLTWMLCGALAALGCFLGCCLMPFCIRGCKDIAHVCPECSRVLGTFRRV
ncbi:hypothetical protein HPB50_003711 [Hyalomma asiaticum]|uniref:Uncharacterized protein n=1 Tax=Hyalomma asiaticum TaxID=266040 RepID=A0ACB7SUJ7_HYAAI|nr:hypothetical protein HPB50_003711 [Hyalomma asiaticum]